MSKLSSFLRLKVYRRTFLLYLVIVLVAITTLLFVFHSNIMSRSLESYVNEADTALRKRNGSLLPLPAPSIIFSRTYTPAADYGTTFSAFLGLHR